MVYDAIEDGENIPNLARNYFAAMIRSSSYIVSGTVLLPSYGLRSYVTTGEDTVKRGFTEEVARVTEGSAEALRERNLVPIPLSMAERMFGTSRCVGQQIAFADYTAGQEILSLTGGRYPSRVYVGGVYRDFPRTSVFKNIILGHMDDNESLNDWETGVHLGFVKLDSEENRELVLQEFEKLGTHGECLTYCL